MTQRSVALLFSDIEGSTRLLQRLGSRYASVLQEHRSLMRHAFDAHGGDEQGTEGDSFFVVFDKPTDAVGAALDAQRALLRHRWPDGAGVRVRMGVHAGEISRVGDGLVGMAIHEAARIMSSASGAQVLASTVAASLASPMPDEASWLDVGEHRLKDIPAPVRLMQLVHPELPHDLPPPRAQIASRSNLPAPTTTLVGRDAEAAEVRALVAGHRFVTLTGSGGAGKTRLAERVGAELEEEFPDGVWFVDLASVADDAGVAVALASSVGASARSSVAAVAEAIAASRALLIVDNCEHVVAASADLVGTVLRACANVHVVATSREPLGTAGEITWRVPSLSAEESVALFVERATAADPRLVIDDAKRSTALTICERLDGIPLAIELAAARLASLGIEQLSERLDQRFRLLTGGRRGGLARQRTLQATVDWSYELLDDEQRRLLRYLGAFVGGFALEGAEHVGEAAGLDRFDVLDRLDALVQKSLVSTSERNGFVRYSLLETIRQYALDRLLDEGELAAARNAHLDWVRAFCAGEAQRLWNAVAPGDVYDRTDAEADNIRSALDWALESGHADAAVQIGAATALYWLARHPFEGVTLFTAIGDATGGTRDERFACAFGGWMCASNSGVVSGDAFRNKMEVLADAVEPGDPYAFTVPPAKAYGALASTETDATERLASVREQVAAAQATGHSAAIGMTRQALAEAHAAAGDMAAARKTFKEMITYCDERGLTPGATRSRYTAARLEFICRDLDTAWDYAVAGLDAARRYRDESMIASFLTTLALFAYYRDDIDTATAFAVESVDYARRTQNPGLAVQSENLVAWIVVTGGDASDGYDYAEAAVERVRGMGVRDQLAPTLHTAAEAARLMGRTDLAVARYLEALDVALEFDLAASTVDVLLGLAAIAAARGDAETAAKLVGATDAHRDDDSAPAHVRHIDAIDRAVADAAGPELARWRAEGAGLSFADARDLVRSVF
jgi:predicted ATPase/class 3 adenylate cyclase